MKKYSNQKLANSQFYFTKLKTTVHKKTEGKFE